MTNEKSIRRVFRIFWAWQDEKEEKWLREMARQGWHLRNVGIPLYTFERGVPIDIVYKLDYHNIAKKDRDEYEGIFRSAGWEHVCRFSNWHYFRKAAAGNDQDIFSDKESRIAMYRRLLGVLVIFVPLLNIGIIRFMRQPEEFHSTIWYILLVSVWSSVILVWAYAIVRLVLRIGKLKRSGKN